MDKVENIFICPKCGGRGVEPHSTNSHLCDACVKAENNRYTLKRKNQIADWLEIAKDAGLDIWLNQPQETQWEYTLWVTYRDSYPGKKPSYREVAQRHGTTLEAVQHAAKRWSWSARLQAWIRHCDDLTMAQRQQEIVDMNKKHIDMAQMLDDKIRVAIEKINPNSLEVKDIAQLLKLSSDLERKARVDTVAAELIIAEHTQVDTAPEVKKEVTKQSDLGEVLAVLNKAGVLLPGSGNKVGIKQTTEVVVMEGGDDS